jgi:putative ABC transport system permease protein
LPLTDLIAFALAALWRHKLRAFLTILGVTIGTATLVISIAVGIGVNEVIDEQYRKEKNLRQITVFPNHEGYDETFDRVPAEVLEIPGAMSDAKRERIKKLAASRWKRRNTQPAPKPLTRDRVEALARIPHVIDVVPELTENGRAFFETRSSEASLYGISVAERRADHRLEAGEGFSAPGAAECLVHEYLLYRWGIQDDQQVRDVIGRTLDIEIATGRQSPLNLLRLFDAELSNVKEDELAVLEKVWKMLPLAMTALPLSASEKEALSRVIGRKPPGAKKEEDRTFRQSVTIVGVIRAPMKSDPEGDDLLDGPLGNADVVLTRELAEQFFNQLPRRQEVGYSRVRVVVDNVDSLEDVVAAIKKMELHEYSPGVIVRQVKRSTVLIGFTMDFIALVALVVAVIGIMNTMFTSVLERTREIGILKAVGARDGQILSIFLVEGGLIGLLGGLGGDLVGWLASFPGNQYALSIMRKQGHTPLPETVFRYPFLLLLAVPLFAMALTTLAAVLPARRAARVEPVVALRHE